MPEITATSREREVDFGTVVIPLPLVWITKRVVKVVNPGGKEDINQIVHQIGDVIFHEITASNVGFGSIGGVAVTDPMITTAGDILSGPIETVTTHDILQPREKFTWTGSYTVTASNIGSIANGVTNLTNYATVTPPGSQPLNGDCSIEMKLARISGTVTQDIGGDRIDVQRPAIILVALTDSSGKVLKTTATNSTGGYVFSCLEGGDYMVTRTHNQDYYDVLYCGGGSDLSKITISGVRGGQECTKNDDDIGDTNIANVTIRLLDKNKVLL